MAPKVMMVRAIFYTWTAMLMRLLWPSDQERNGFMKKRNTIIGAVLAIVLACAAWAFGFFDRSDPAVTELQELGKQMWDKDLPDAQRNQVRQDFRERIGSLSDDQRRAFFDANRDQWSGRMQERMDDFFKMSQADQQKHLDEILNRIVQGRKSPQQGNQQNGRGAGNNRGGRNMTDAQREERSKRRLDRSTPRMRAQVAQFRKQLDQRAQQRGISLGGGGGGWGFGPRGGA